jgi:hypothetical protein
MTETVQKEHWIQPEPYYEDHPWFFGSWRRRHEKNKNLIMCATGQSLGIGKTYWLLAAFEQMYPDFTVDQIVFVPKQFWDILDGLPTGEWAGILWDDPTKGLQKRDWYKDVNKAVTSFAKTASRYRRRDLGFALPSFDDLDIALREIMTLEAQMKEAGIAKVHRIKRNRFGSPPFWKPYLGEVSLRVPRLASEYEKRREEFNRTAYKQEEFEEAPREVKGWLRVYEAVIKEPDKFKVKDRLHPLEMILSPKLISGGLDCSRQTADKVIAKIEFEKRVQPLEK